MLIPELVVDSHCVIGEGPVWDERTGELYFIDILGKSMFCYANGKIIKKIKFEQSLGFAVLREQGGVVAGLKDGYYFADFDGNGAVHILDPEPGREDGRFNDGKVDPAGRVWGGTMPVSLDTGYGNAGPDSALYCMNTDKTIKTMLTGVIQGNGLAWSKDTKKFYFVDTQKFCVQEFAYDSVKNELAHGRVCVDIPVADGIPDGMTIDDDGMLWVALWGGSCVKRFDPSTGKTLECVVLPAPNVTSCCFGGMEMEELYITTASLGTDLEKYPLAGGVFKAKVGVKGAFSHRFKG